MSRSTSEGRRGVGTSRVYSEEERARALALVKEIGFANARRRLGIPSGTLGTWQSKVGGSGKGGGHRVTAVPPETPVESSLEDGAGSPGGVVEKSRVARVYTPSQRAQALEYEARHGPMKASRDLGISRFSLRDWKRKARLARAGESVKNPLEGTDEDPGKEKERRVLAEWEGHRGLGPSQIRNQLRRAGVKVSVHFARRVMEENGYVAPKVKRKNVHDQRYEAVRPGQLWHADFWHRHVNKQRVYVLLMLDDYSRFLVGAAMWEGERVDAVIETFEESVSRYGKPETMMSDGGSAFYSWRGVGRFTRILEEYGVDQLVAKTPQVNGKSEILNANLAKELFNQERFFDLGEAQRRLSAWVDFYNFKRTHHALGGLLVPADRFFGRADRVLAAIEAGRPADGLAEPAPVGARMLDFLRVTSTGGLVEVYLMGERLWPQTR